MLLDLEFAALLAVWAIGIGLAILNRLRSSPEHPADAIGLAIPLGLGTLALATIALAEFGLLNGPTIAALLAVGGLVGARPAVEGLARLRRSWAAAPRFDSFDAILAVGLAGTLATALAPVTDGDALCYHLQVPKIFLHGGAATFDPDLHETVYPLSIEMLYAIALAARGPVACRLIQWLLGVAFAANVAALARPSLGERASWAGAIALLAPAVSNGMGAPLNDVALAAFGNAAIVAWLRHRDCPCTRSAALAGAFLGLAIGVKYPALVLLGVLGLATLVASRRGVAHAAVLGTSALAVGGCWYLRAFAFTGNPVYPFFRQVFGGAGLDVVLDPIKRPLAVTPWNILTAIGPLTLEPDRFDSFSHQFGPIFLLFLPALLWMRPPKRVIGVVAIGYAFMSICLTQRQSMRFVLIALGPLSVGVAWLACAWRDRPGLAGRALLSLLLAGLACEAALATARARHGIAVVIGLESADAYLDRRESTHKVGGWVAANLPVGATIVGQDHRGFYIPRPYTMELAHRRRTGLGSRGESPAELVAGLRRSGFTHVMFCPPVPETAVEFDPALGRALAPWTAARRPIYRESIADGDGVVRRYAIYDLEAPRIEDVAEREVPP